MTSMESVAEWPVTRPAKRLLTARATPPLERTTAKAVEDGRNTREAEMPQLDVFKSRMREISPPTYHVPESRPTAGAPEMPNGLDILVVEDDPCIGTLLSEVLSDIGYSVVGIVDTAKEAIAFSGERRLDLAIVDVWLAGGSNGLAAVRHLTGRKGIPTIVCSGHAAASEAMAAGALAFLEKPFRITDLERALDRATAASVPGVQAPEALA